VKITPNRPYRPAQLGLDDLEGVLWGVFVGGCVDERNSWGIWDGTRSHAHNHPKSEWFGWVCIPSPKDVLTPRGKMTSTLAHEIAHLMAPDQGHTRLWKNAITELGFASEITRSNLKPL
jgi:hypothetical protein